MCDDLENGSILTYDLLGCVNYFQVNRGEEWCMGFFDWKGKRRWSFETKRALVAVNMKLEGHLLLLFQWMYCFVVFSYAALIIFSIGKQNTNN